MVLFAEARAGLVAGIVAAEKYNTGNKYVFDGMKGVELKVHFMAQHPLGGEGLLDNEDPVEEYEGIAAGTGPVDVCINVECRFGEDFAGAECRLTVDSLSDMRGCMDAAVGALVRAAVSAAYRDEGTEAVAVDAAAEEFSWNSATFREAEIMLGPVVVYRQRKLARVLM